MKRLILYVTSEKLKTILPLVIEECVDFNVSDMDGSFDAWPARSDAVITGSNPLNRSYNPKDLEIVNSQVVEKEIKGNDNVLFEEVQSSCIQETEASEAPEPEPKKRKMQKFDYKGRRPWEVVIGSFEELNRTVLERKDICAQLKKYGFGEGTATSAISRAVGSGLVRMLNSGRISCVNTKGQTLKSLQDLEVVNIKQENDNGR